METSIENDSNFENISLHLDQWLRKMRCNGLNEKGITLEQFQDIKVGVLAEDVTSGTPCYEPFPDMKNEKFVYEGERDKSERFHGSGSVEFEDGSTMTGCWSHGQRMGHFIIVTERQDLNYIEGEYMNDKLEGKGRVKFKDNACIEGFFKEAILHGFCRCFSAKNRLTSIGIYANGKPIGTYWRIIEGGGCIVGRVDKEGLLSGPDIAYIYPDFRTALVGGFVAGVLSCGQHCSLIGATVESGCLMAPVFSEKKGPIFKREISTDIFVTINPTLQDPYETNTIKVRASKVPGASEGLFARSDVKKDTILAFYNGIKLPADYEEEDTWEANAYKIFDPANQPDGALDILEEHQSTSGYSASLAHKTNHSFNPNSQFLLFDHPRWGLVPCIASTRKIVACEEIFVRYGYDLDLCPDWYAEAWNKGSYEVIKARGRYFTIDDMTEQLPNMGNIHNAYID